MDAATLVYVLKRQLKGKGITYATPAQVLVISEASVERPYSRRDFTPQRLEDVCRVAGVELAELARAAGTFVPVQRNRVSDRRAVGHRHQNDDGQVQFQLDLAGEFLSSAATRLPGNNRAGVARQSDRRIW